MKQVLIFGKFDILHPGHISFIKYAQTFGSLVVVLESDQAIKRVNNFLPVESNVVRQKNLEKLGAKVFLRHSEDMAELLRVIDPDLICLGYDQSYLKEALTAIAEKTKPRWRIIYAPALKPQLFKASKLRSIIEDKAAEVYLLDKSKGANSFKVVSILRKILNIKKVGFSGTLDPLATGLMIVATGKATRLLDWFHDLNKVYEAQIIFGQTSATYDLESEAVINVGARAFTKKTLEANLNKFLGKQSQRVPIYSAKKVQGKKLHEVARRGQPVVAPLTNIEIYSLKIKKFSYPELVLEVSCSAGTYIRSLAHDLGESLDTGAVLAGLRRTQIGPWQVEEALPIDKITKASLATYRRNPQEFIDYFNGIS